MSPLFAMVQQIKKTFARGEICRKKGIYYKKNLKKGRKISFSLVKVKNFKVGIKANDINKIINKKIIKDVKIINQLEIGILHNEKKKCKN